MKGDVNQDNLIKYEDACTILRNIGGTPSCCLDLDNDRRVTSTDALRAMLIAFEAIQENRDGGTNTELCGGCGRNSCNVCTTQNTCYNAGCAWRNNACYGTCSVEGQINVECATGSYCSSGHCCPVGYVWDPNLRGPGIGGCRQAEISGPCTLEDARTHRPYLPTNPRYDYACCPNLGN